MNYVIIGNSASGIACIEAIRSKDKRSKITVISEEDYHIYSRCLLSYFLAGNIKEENLIYRTDDFYKANKVEALIGCRCEKVLPERQIIKVYPVRDKSLNGAKDKNEIKFDKLLIATGARPKFPDIKGIEKDGVFGLRTIRDAKMILGLLKGVKTIAILGGGLIGLKAAYGLSTHNKDIKVLVKSNQVLSQILDKRGASIFQDWIEKKQIQVMTGLEATEILGKDKVEGLSLDNGKTLECEMVIVGKGVQPNLELVKDTKIKVDEGILVDEFLRTNIDGIHASGDVAQAKDSVTGEMRINALWPVAVEEGAHAGLNMAGVEVSYDGSMAMNSVEFFGLPLISMGITRSKEGLEELVYEDSQRRIYKKIVLKNNLIAGMIFVNDIKSSGVVGGLIKNKIDVTSIKDMILDENFDFAKIASLIKENKDKFKKEEFKDIILTY